MTARSHGPTQGWRIIATDDNTSKRSAIVVTLRSAGYCVFAAYDGKSALELVAQLPNINLLLTNNSPGVVDSPELMRRTRELRPAMPILHLIHQGDPPVGTPPDVLTLRQPFTPDQLLVAVGSLLAQAKVSGWFPSGGNAFPDAADKGAEIREQGSEAICLGLGAVLLGLGVYFLLQPGVGDAEIINLGSAPACGPSPARCKFRRW